MALQPGTVVYEPGDRLEHIYLPATAVFSMLQVSDGGVTTEIAVIGRDGLLGLAAFLGGEPVSTRAVVQTGGLTYCLDVDFGGQLQDLVLRFSQALITQMAQTAYFGEVERPFR
jgi:CRP-like cAMP-binding protein